MKYERYITLIKELEVSAAQNRKGYELKVLLLIVLGYAYFVGLIVLLITPLLLLPAALIVAPAELVRVGLVFVKFWFVLVPATGLYFGFIGSAVRSIVAKVPDPPGTEISRSDAPDLFAFVDSACKELKAARPKRVLVNDEMNASIVTMPRFGIFGRKVLLILGIPLMRSLSPEQLKAVIAHEIGHISGKHGVFAKWAYQMREAWIRLIGSQAETENTFNSLYKRFVDWFFPYFDAYSFVLMREHERDADRDACALVGGQYLGEALVQMEAKHQAMNEEFWGAIHKENIQSETPPEGTFTRMLGSLSFSGVKTAANMQRAFSAPTDFDDSHPSLGERLRSIGYWLPTEEMPKVPANTGENAANVFLGPALSPLVSAFDDLWDEEIARSWGERYAHHREAAARIAELTGKHVESELTLEELRELTGIITERDGMDAALPYVEEAAERFPEDGVAWYNLGLARLANDDDRGLVDLARSASLDQGLKFDADQLAFNYLRAKGRIEESVDYANAIDDQLEAYKKAEQERLRVDPTDELEAHDLPAEFIESLPKRLAGLEEISRIYAAHKKVSHFPELPFRVLFVELRPRTKADAEPSAILEIVQRNVDTGEIHYVAILDDKWGNTGKRLDALPGSLIYPRNI